ETAGDHRRSGSQYTFMSTELANRLGGKIQPFDGCVTGLGGVPISGVRGWLVCRIRSTIEDKKFKIRALVVDQITSTVPKRPVPQSVASHLSRYCLADPSFSQPGRGAN
ncbi:hypothetical protein, partial [Klebsiella pneumoniae]|uniref:hypothetical protein n=1 Tax=Klebsiella pneumoniae TaxID=573 RepID=UPI00405568D5